MINFGDDNVLILDAAHTLHECSLRKLCSNSTHVFSLPTSMIVQLIVWYGDLCGPVVHESEVSVFNREAYETFKASQRDRKW